MNVDEILQKNKLLEEENAKLRNELNETKERLKKYTAPAYKKEYYEKNKELLLEKMKANPASPDKRKEYNKQAYLRRKEKLKKDEEEKQNNENI